MDAEKCYFKRKQSYDMFLEKLEASLHWMFYTKLGVIIGGIGVSSFLFILGKYPLSGGMFLFGILLFIFLDIRHRKILKYQQNSIQLSKINEQSLKRFDGSWTSFPDTGAEFLDEGHPYLHDLDILGKGSLFQWVNVTRTFRGRQRLYEMLAIPAVNSAVINQRQAAIQELACNLRWRQWLTVYGTVVAEQMKDPKGLIEWGTQGEHWVHRNAWIIFLRSLPILTGVFVVYYFLQVVPWYFPLMTLFLHYLLLKIDSKRRNQILTTVEIYKNNLALYLDLLRHIETKHFEADLLQLLQSKLYRPDLMPASKQLGFLTKIADALANRNNFFYGLVNLLTLWDYHCLIALLHWKEKSGKKLSQWFEVIGEFEALSSLAIIRFDHPDWAIPEFVETSPYYTAKSLGHPLLNHQNRVTNDLQLNSSNQVLLITGSNMSGKSTFLRTAGINLVLAYAGAPVCAKTLRSSIMRIYTCMRISDNLEKSISTFYAELIRIKMIITASNDSKPIFFLLDEIFKGTNSLDRHTGAKILIKKLIKTGAIGMVSTHDLELGQLESECQKVKNYHFQEYFQNGQLHFDYKLRLGISQTRNALYLMRAVGIEMEVPTS